MQSPPYAIMPVDETDRCKWPLAVKCSGTDGASHLILPLQARYLPKLVSLRGSNCRSRFNGFWLVLFQTARAMKIVKKSYNYVVTSPDLTIQAPSVRLMWTNGPLSPLITCLSSMPDNANTSRELAIFKVATMICLKWGLWRPLWINRTPEALQ